MTTANQVQTKHLPKQKGLDMLKGIAIIGIFLYHLIPSIFPGGFLGVPLFFVLSGYLMFTTSTSYLNTETFPVMDYYKKRIRRIIPPLFIMVMLVCCAMTLMKSRQMIGIREQILSIFLGYNNWCRMPLIFHTFQTPLHLPISGFSGLRCSFICSGRFCSFYIRSCAGMPVRNTPVSFLHCLQSFRLPQCLCSIIRARIRPEFTTAQTLWAFPYFSECSSVRCGTAFQSFVHLNRHNARFPFLPVCLPLFSYYSCWYPEMHRFSISAACF